ncbi:orotidine-5'-phosphate decarboxylase [Pseudactinotalea suaedae]|uniref:orotidine-5'-phosphate decarboxylase n=1 Tax=Pseudactinotalea suaedae TaxID=1524924 RepID=UPI0012E1DFDE|nr:orotidine-5'-phosphate decarboxylase [Pseudactinotalea suaedae]
MSTIVPFGTRLADAMDSHGPLCVGIDPHPGLVREWGLPDGVAGLREFALRTLEAVGPHVAAVKPQAAFYERWGSAGFAVLEELIAGCRAAGVLCIVDAKRGDIGSTMNGYADAFLGKDSPLAGDCVTLSPYLGYGSLAPAIAEARATGRGVLVLALTSNPEGAEVQHARTAAGTSVAAAIAAHASADNAQDLAGGARLGTVGLVTGATIGSAPTDVGADLAAVRGPLLAPGLGEQGGRPEDLEATFGAAVGAVLASASRSVLRAGPDPAALGEAARRLAAELAAATGRA